MEETSNIPAPKRIAVVTGANKGIGLEICRQIASNGGVKVVLTARDEKRGQEAIENLKISGLTDIVFHQLDLLDPSSIASFANFIQTQFGRLDILVNNAGATGVFVEDAEGYSSLNFKSAEELLAGSKADLAKQIVKQTYQTAELCLNTNYYGTKQVTEALIPLLQQSNSARIVNISSGLGQLKFISNEKAKKELEDVDGLTEEKVDEVVKGFLEDAKEELLETKGWPSSYSAYAVSKVSLNAYTRILAKKFPNMCINAVSPGYVKTDINYNNGIFTVEEGARGPVKLALSSDGGPSGLYFYQTQVSTF